MRTSHRRQTRESDQDLELLEDGFPQKQLLSESKPLITISEDFTMDLADRFCTALDEIRRFGSSIILVEINSMGGDAFALMKMLNAIATCGMKVATYCPSVAYSAGAELLCAGEPGMRFMSPLSSLMLHPMSLSCPSAPVGDAVRQVEHYSELNKIMFNRLAKHIGTTPNKLRKALVTPDGTARWFTPKEAKALNLIDVVGYPIFQEELTLHAVTD